PGRGCHAVRLRSSRPIRRSSGRVCARALGGSRTHRSWYTRIHGPELEEEIVDGQRARRSCLAVPGSSAKMIDKARTLPADQFFLDLEDAVSPLAKDEARQQVVAALDEGGWSGKVRSVRVNSLDTEWTYRDVITVVEGAGAELDTIILPKVSSPDHVRWLDLTLTQVERANGLDVGRIGIEPQIEDASGLMNVDAIAGASPRVEALIYGPADFMASINMRSLVVGHQPPGYDVGDAYHYVL